MLLSVGCMGETSLISAAVLASSLYHEYFFFIRDRMTFITA